MVVAETPWTRENSPRADAIVTRVPGLAIGVGTADCGPILFADGEAGVVGAAHAGWKGALTGVLEATDRGDGKARRDARAHPRRDRPADPPAELRGRRRVRRALHGGGRGERDGSSSPAARAGHAMFDLPGFIRSRLERAGIAGVEDLGLCTYADPARFFSYRRTTHRGEPDYGRHVNAIALMRIRQLDRAADLALPKTAATGRRGKQAARPPAPDRRVVYGWTEIAAARACARSVCVALPPRCLRSCAAGCSETTSSNASLHGLRPSGPTIAFDSIDGPPVGVFNRLVDNLSAEAQGRQLAIASREGAANYRVRGYLAAQVIRGRTHISWVWDVYDDDKLRALRITGEEAGGPRRRRPVERRRRGDAAPDRPRQHGPARGFPGQSRPRPVAASGDSPSPTRRNRHRRPQRRPRSAEGAERGRAARAVGGPLDRFGTSA